MSREVVFCPVCGDKMDRLYSRQVNPQTKKRYWNPEGWICNNELCRQILRD